MYRKMAQAKTEVLSLRVTPDAKSLLLQCAEREHRSMASMVEYLVHEYAKKRDGKSAPESTKKSQRKSS
jgi:hypothetical protein